MAVLFQKHITRIAAIALVFAVYSAARLPDIPDRERQQLAERFRFTKQVLPDVGEGEPRQQRPVHPGLQGISAWISSVGAAIALGDLDGDQFPNDICYVDTRTDQVVIAPAADTGKRYPSFVLVPGDSLFDRTTMAPMGCVPGDFNEDGLNDILVYYWGRTPLVFLRREGNQDGPAELNAESYLAQEIVPGGERWFTNAVTRADVDGDGHVDLVIGNYFQDGARILDADAGGTESMQHSMSRAFNGGCNRILLWSESTSGPQPAVQFRDVPGVFEIDGEPVATAWTLAIGAADLDGDLLPELYFGNDFGPDRLLHNRSQPGQPRFALLTGRRGLLTPASKVLGKDSFKGMGVDFADLNDDGLLDILVSNIASEYALEESHFVFVSTGEIDRMHEGVAPYVDVSEQLGLSRSGWGWSIRPADLDNDGVSEVLQATGFVRGENNGWAELHEIAMGNDQLLSTPMAWHHFGPGVDLSGHDPNPFFVRAADGRYYDIAPQLGLHEAIVSRGIATADADGDGDLDFAVANQWEPSYFFQNECPKPGKHLGLRLLVSTTVDSTTSTRVLSGHVSPGVPVRPAIGAVATVDLPDGRQLVAHVDGGNGHSGVRSPELHFGLGDVSAEKTVRVRLRWRDAIGRAHAETHDLRPGWHTVLLSNKLDR